MRTRSITVFLALAWCCSGRLHAEGILHQLPDDGTWAQFEMTDVTTRNGRETKLEKTFRISSVGTDVVDGETCRWIEFRTETPNDKIPQGRLFVEKLLIPEKHLRGEGDPLRHVLRLWHKRVTAPKVFKENPDDPKHFSPLSLRYLHAYLHEPLKDSRKLEKAVVVSKSSLGSLECHGVSASETYKETTEDAKGKNVFRMDSTYTVRLHPKAPFGVVTWERELKLQRNGMPDTSIVTKLKLTNFGKDAKSELPGFDLREPIGEFLQAAPPRQP